MDSVYNSVRTSVGIRRVSQIGGPQDKVDTWKSMFFQNVTFYVRCSEVYQFLIPFFVQGDRRESDGFQKKKYSVDFQL